MGFQAHKTSGASLPAAALEPQSKANVVDSRDNGLYYLFNRYMSGVDGAADELKAEIDVRELADYQFRAIVTQVTADDADKVSVDAIMNEKLPLTAFDCHRAAHSAFEEACGKFTDYSLKYVRSLSNLCEVGYEAEEVA